MGVFGVHFPALLSHSCSDPHSSAPLFVVSSLRSLPPLITTRGTRDRREWVTSGSNEEGDKKRQRKEPIRRENSNARILRQHVISLGSPVHRVLSHPPASLESSVRILVHSVHSCQSIILPSHLIPHSHSASVRFGFLVPPSPHSRRNGVGMEWDVGRGGTACDSSLKSLPVSVVHPQTLGIACQLLPFPPSPLTHSASRFSTFTSSPRSLRVSYGMEWRKRA